jgi:hypothetical protein
MSEPIKMYWWGEKYNFGDYLNPLLAKQLFGVSVAHEPDPLKAEVIGIGSMWDGDVIGEQHKLPEKGVHVWGTGFYGGESSIHEGRLIPHLVRGHHTASRFPGYDGAVGDAGLLSSRILEVMPGKKYKTGILCHWSERGSAAVASAVERLEDSVLIDVQQHPREVIGQIALCTEVLSSSLHGLVVADSLEVPNLRVRFTDSVGVEEAKFADYYSVFAGVDPRAIPIHPDRPLPEIDHDTYSRPGLDELKENIAAAFPL